MTEPLATAVAAFLIALILAITGTISGTAAGILTLPAIASSTVRDFNDVLTHAFFNADDSYGVSGWNILTHVGISIAYALPYALLTGTLAIVIPERHASLSLWGFTGLYALIGLLTAVWWLPRSGYDWVGDTSPVRAYLVFGVAFVLYYGLFFVVSVLTILAVISPFASL